MSLRVIDIASWQQGIVPSRVDCDAVIVKATGGTWYENPYFEQWVDDVLASGRPLGIYHYAVESVRWKSAAEEAEYFLQHVRRYKGKFVPVLDWESDAMELPQEWALEWMQIVERELGSKPIFYAYASHLNSKDYSKVAARYPLWMASYLNRYDGAGWVDDPRNTWDFGSWDSMLMYQYTSTGNIEGYGRDLDLSVFYGSRSDWERMCAPKPAQPSTTPVNDANLLYRSHVQDLGWLDAVRDGQTAGTVGFGKRLEAFKITPPEGWTLWAKVHVANVGWVTYDGITRGKSSGEGSSANDPIIGTVGKGSAIECVMLGVSKRPEGDKRRLRFRVHQQDKGWKGWTLEGFASGTDGMGLRLEAIEMVIK